MTKYSLKYLICSDLYRYYGRVSTTLLLRELVFGIGFKYSFWYRLCYDLKRRPKWCYPVFVLCYMILRHYMFKFGIQIAYDVTIGPGFYIGHWGGIVVNGKAVIGKNCNLSHEVTIGKSNRGDRAGVPVIGDNVYIGPGAKIFGKVAIGDNAAIGANAVVTKDVGNNESVGGVPARVLSLKGSEGYVNRTDYDSYYLNR